MKIYNLFLFLALITFIRATTLLAEWEDQLNQHDEGLYSAKIPSKPLLLVMERITDQNRPLWRHYALKQNEQLSYMAIKDRFPKFTDDGSGHFLEVFDQVDHQKNEVWVAYITTDNQARHVSEEDPKGYRSSLSKAESFFGNIVMYVTVVSSPEALITSHMGVSSSHEGLEKNIRGISIDLHSFGAKVMLLRNPARKYMVNAPATVMETILAKAMPAGSFFAGNKELVPILEKKVAEIEEKIQGADRERNNLRKKLLETATSMQENESIKMDRLKTMLANKKISEDEFNIEKANWFRPEQLAQYYLVEKDNIIVISNDLIEKQIERQIAWNYGLQLAKPGLDLIRSYGPQLISVDGADGKTPVNQLVLFDKNDPNIPWLIIKKGDPNYNWLFTKPFEPAGRTHLIVADLKTLADIAQISR
jgi:hypothetical protein